MASRADRSLVSQWLWTVDKWLLVSLVSLLLFGLIVSPAASPAVAERINVDTFYFVKRHALYLIPALLAMIGTSFLTVRQARRFAGLMLIGSLALMLLTVFFGFEAKGARRWISIFGFSIQASEFLKPAFIVVSAWFFSESMKRNDVPGNAMALLLLVVCVMLLVTQPDLGQTILLVTAWGAVLFMAGLSWGWVIALGALSFAFLISAYFVFGHVAQRIDRFLTGEGDTFQTDRSIEAVIEGGWYGQGLGEGIVKRGLPDAHADFAFAVVAEEFGIFACMALVAVFGFVVLRALSHSLREQDPFLRLATGGLAVLFGAQVFINIGVNLKMLPAKGMTLPFVSFGGSSLVAVAIGMGLLLAFTRRRPEERGKQASFKDLSFVGSRFVAAKPAAMKPL